jgi:outer membrane protein assembly factor BamB
MTRIGSALVLFACASIAAAADWPQWRGLHRDGVSPDTGLLKTWPKAGPPLLWETRGAGRGYSSIAVAAGKVYTVGDTSSTAPDSDEYLLSFDEANGKELWKAKLGSPYKHNNKQWESSRSTPTVDGELLYILTGNGELICLETSGGKERWRKSLPKDFGGKKGDGWGYGESVLIDGDQVVCTPGGKTTLAALNKKTGETVWTTIAPSNPGAGHASIVVTEVGNTRVYVQSTAGLGLGVRARDGKILWKVDNLRATAVIPTPVVRGDLVLLAAGYGRGGTLVRQVPDSNGGVKVEEIYPFNRSLSNKHGGIVLVGDYLFGDTEDSGSPFCVEFMTGRQKWKARTRGGSVSIAAAGGMLYLHSANGTMTLAKASPERFQEVSSFKVAHAGERPGWAHPVLANGKLFVREGDYILCYDLRAR